MSFLPFIRASVLLFSPLAPGWRGGIVTGRDFVGGAEVDLGITSQRFRPFLLDDLARGFFDRVETPATRRAAPPFPLAPQPVDECLAGQNRRRRDREIGFRF